MSDSNYDHNLNLFRYRFRPTREALLNSWRINHSPMTTGWNTYGHDTGHTNVNDAVDGPVDLDQEWTLHPDVQHQPVVRNGRIYVACSNRQVSAFDVDGSGAWSYSHPPPEEFANDSIDEQYFGRGTNPVVDGATVYHLVNNRLVLLDASDGTELERTLFSTSTGIPAGDGAVQVGLSGRLYVAFFDRIWALESDPWSHVWSESTTKLQDPPAVDAAGGLPRLRGRGLRPPCAGCR